MEVERLHSLLPAGLQPVAVRRIADQQAGRRRRNRQRLAGVCLRDTYGVGHVRRGDVLGRSDDGLFLAIESGNRVGCLPLAGLSLAAEIGERPRSVGTHVRPTFDRERAPEARGAPARDQRGLDRERARAAHRIEERLVPGVLRRAQNRGCERLLERRHNRAHAVAAAV